MYKTEELTLPITKKQSMYETLLRLYPDQYRKRFDEQMLFVFQDQYEEELAKQGHIGSGFWFSVAVDVMYSAAVEHINTMRKQGMKKYVRNTLHINNYNIVGGILLLPIFVVFSIDVFARIAQGDLTHYNRPVYAFMSHTPFYQFPILLTWVLIFPLLAIVINLVPLVKHAIATRRKFIGIAFIQKNVLGIFLVLMALGFLTILALHDFAPCVVNGILAGHLPQFFQLVQYCRNA